MAKAKAPVRTELSRAEQEEVIRSGGSVMIDGEIYTKISDLPDTAESIKAAEDELADRKRRASGLKTPAEIKAMKVEELDQYAADHEIDLSGAKLKDDKVAAILKAQEG